MDAELSRKIEERARALWERDGKPPGKEADYRRRAEQELLDQSVGGEEDPLEALDHDPPGGALPKRGD